MASKVSVDGKSKGAKFSQVRGCHHQAIVLSKFLFGFSGGPLQAIAQFKTQTTKLSSHKFSHI
jgi:hypothetical protein